MDFAKYFIKNTTTSWLVIAILIIGGIVSFLNVGRLEDPQFTIKQALIITNYPGALTTASGRRSDPAVRGSAATLTLLKKR